MDSREPYIAKPFGRLRAGRSESIPNGLGRGLRFVILASLVAGSVGCESSRPRGYATPPANDLALELTNRETEIADLRDQTAQAEERAERLSDALAAQKDVEDVLKKRVANLKQENDRLAAEVTGVVMNAATTRATIHANTVANVSSTSAVAYELPKPVVESLRAFATKYQDRAVVFVPEEKVIRFVSREIFERNGTDDRLRLDAEPVLKELAALLAAKDAGNYDFAIVGHTAKPSVTKRELAAQHPTDWHLAAHQAIVFQQYLEEFGVTANRFKIGSYAAQQPLPEIKDASDNARVEIFLIPPDPVE